MPTFPRERIRIRVNTDAKAGTSGIVDDITGSNPDCWKGTNVQFEIGLFFSEQLIDISNIQTLTFTAKDITNKTGPKLFEKSISQADMDLTLTEDAWTAGTGQHAILEFTPAEMNIDLNGQDSKTLWLMIHGISTEGDRLALGAAKLTVNETGIDSGLPSPVVGGNIIPAGSVYNGSGQYTVAVSVGKVYDWSKGSNDATLVNGTETLGASGRFTAQGSTVVLTGTIGTLVNGFIRGSTFYTADEVNALLAGTLKIVNGPGVVIWVQSQDGRWLRGFTVTEDGDIANPRIDRQATP